MINRLTTALDFQTQALTLRAERQRLIASNIANADTPGYVARDFNFAQALQQATGGSRGGFKLDENAALATPSPGGRGEGTGREPRLNYAAAAQSNLDRNSVDMDRERASFVDNALRYESTLRFISSSVKTTLDAMKSHTQS
ncbi:MAG: flagellar basal body rod protein FlgB [Rubrivivax sp.]|nr:flagellar basal body rod protein FlgB [Rubrivivax sp.]MBK7262926.1 flagellar basal body rod protein FlgB [Rubrivivax sp.]MBK8529098.1 flagellar basal body rod protein FlgB [Rubrivivax sp.]